MKLMSLNVYYVKFKDLISSQELTFSLSLTVSVYITIHFCHIFQTNKLYLKKKINKKKNCFYFIQ